MMPWFKGLPWGVRLAVLALVVAAVTGMVVALMEEPAWWLVILAAAGTLAVGVLAELWKHWESIGKERADEKRRRDEQARERSAAEREFQRRARLALVAWPAPPVTAADPFALGVARPVPALQEVAGNGLGPYIRRDRDTTEVPDKLRARGQLLIVGDSGSGATRTAFEAASALADGGDPRPLLAPVAPDGPRTVVELGLPDRMPHERVVLWLDRVDRYSTDGLTVQHLQALREAWPGLRVVATITPTAYERWTARRPDLAAAFDVVRLPRVPSPRERQEAAARYPGLDVGRGIGAAFTGLRDLLDRYTAGDTGCPFEPDGATCEVSRTAVAAAAGWWGTGTPRPLTRAALHRLAAALCGPAATAEHLDRALAWATDPVPQGAALLAAIGGGEAALAIDPRLAELIADGQPPPAAVWRAALDDADAAQDTGSIGLIGLRAHLTGIAQTRRRDLTPDRRRELQQSVWADLATAAREAWDGIPSLDAPGIEQLYEAAGSAKALHLPRFRIDPTRRILQLWEEHYGPDHPEVAPVLTSLGNALQALGQPGDAVPIFERALAIEEEHCDPGHPDSAAVLNNLGNALVSLGNPGEAIPLYRRALAIQEERQGPDHPETAVTLSNLGGALRNLGKPGDAVPLYGRALTIKEQHYGPEHHQTAGTINSLGGALAELGKPGAAIPLHRRALAIQEEHYGPVHPQVAPYLAALGAALHMQRRSRDAIPLYLRALAIQEEHYGPAHPETAGTLSNLGGALTELNKPGEAVPLLKRALAIKEEHYGPDHPETAVTLNNLGNALRALGKPGDAVPLYVRAWRTFRTSYGPDHDDTLAAERALRALDCVPMDDGTVHCPDTDHPAPGP